jgi:lysophospholipase L1-like esterase
MKQNSFNPHSALRIALVASTLTLGACDAVNELVDDINDIDNDADGHYYLSLGTSLSVGVQPSSGGTLLPGDDGYPNQLFDSIKPAFEAGGAAPRELRLVQLGCPGETLDDMINGGNCLYIAGSQLDAAVDFLNDNAGQVHLVTIDMGANDFRNAGCVGAIVDIDCATDATNQISTDLAIVLAALQNAADPGTTIVGMNYYNPYLATWLDDAAGQTLAVESAQAVALATNALGTTYGTAGVLVADVAAAFESDDFVTMVLSPQPAPNDMLPVNVANVCTFTYMCDPAPVGPDIHANNAGYARIAEAFEAVLP